MNIFENIYKSNTEDDTGIGIAETNTSEEIIPETDNTETERVKDEPVKDEPVKDEPDETDNPETDNPEMKLVNMDPENTPAELETIDASTPPDTDLDNYIEDIDIQERLTDKTAKQQYFEQYLQNKLGMINTYDILSSKLSQNPAVNITPYIQSNSLINESLYIPIVKHKVSQLDSYKMRKYDKYGLVLNQSGMIEYFGIFCTNRTEFKDDRLLIPSAITNTQTSLRPTTTIAKMYNADRRTFMYNLLESKTENSNMFTDMFSYYIIFNSFNNNSNAFAEYYKNISDPHNLKLYNDFLMNSSISYEDFKQNYTYTSYIKPHTASEDIIQSLDFYKTDIKGDPESILVKKYPIPELSVQQKRLAYMFQEHPATLKYFMKLHTDGYFYIKKDDVLDQVGVVYPYTILTKRAANIHSTILNEHPEITNTTELMLEASDFDKTDYIKICCKHIFMLYTNISYEIIVDECEQDNICKICTEELPDITDYNPHIDIFNGIIVKYLNCIGGVYNGIVVVAALSEIINSLCKYIIGENSSDDFDFKEIRIAVGALALRYVIKKTIGKVSYNTKLKKTIAELEQIWNEMAVKHGNLPSIDKLLSMESEFESIKESTNRLAIIISKRNYDFAHSIDRYNNYPLTVMFNQEIKLLDDISGYKNYIKENAGNKDVLEIFTEGYDYMDAYNFGVYRLWLNGYLFKGITDEWIVETSVSKTGEKDTPEKKIVKVKHKAETSLKGSSKLFQLGVKPKENDMGEIYKKYKPIICPNGMKHEFDAKGVCLTCGYNKDTKTYTENDILRRSPEISYDTDFYTSVIETKNKVIKDELYTHYAAVKSEIRADNLRHNIEGKINFNLGRVSEFIQAVDASSTEIIKDIHSVLKVDLSKDMVCTLKEIVSYLFSGICKPKFSEYGSMIYNLWCYRKGYSINLLY